jgi:ATP-dependent DNA helicase PIF1
MSLHEDQARAYELIRAGANVFLTGPAGSGKSYLLSTVCDWAAANGKTLALTALTGCAALLLGNKAKTLHSWAGVGIATEPAHVLVSHLNGKFYTKNRWRKTDILVIDEVSMLTPDFFDKLDIIGRALRRKVAPFGGIQLILCGDFLQLPPVHKGLSGEMGGRFVFESATWASCRLRPAVLTQIARQKDPVFQTILNECRVGKPSDATVAALTSRTRQDWKSRVIKPTLLFSRNAEVNAINEKNIAALNKPLRTYKAATLLLPAEEERPTGDRLAHLVGRLDNDSSYSPTLELCEGAQVMLLVNLDVARGLVNGSRGVIVGFRSDGIPIVQFLHGEPVAVEPHSWTSPDHTGVLRKQIPLRVAYAITIHKSQGATLDCALVDIGSSTFECGQAYVALSRVKDLESLYVFTLDATKIRAHPKVVAFYESLTPTPPLAAAK